MKSWKKQRTANIGLAIWQLKCFFETFVQGSTLVLRLNFCAKNPPHRQAENRVSGLTIYYYNKSRNIYVAEVILFNEDLKVKQAFVHYKNDL